MEVKSSSIEKAPWDGTKLDDNAKAADSTTKAEAVPADQEDEGMNERETWGRTIDFLLALIGFSVGLGNVWRFPYLCYKNGGGAFLLPYLICVLIGGVPMLYLEVALGQYMQVGGLGVWNIIPLFKGIGVATTMIVAMVNCYYNVILTWSFYYLFSSFTTTLPWTTCTNWWNTDRCLNLLDGSTRNGSNFTALNATGNASFVDPVTEFWQNKVLAISDKIENVGTVKWDLALCLVFAWIVVYLCIWKGIKSSGKVMYVTATSPYILMLILMIRGCFLPGAMEGIKYYLIPDWSRLADPQVWVDAGTQIFFSYSISLGTLIALGSYNNYHHNSYKHSIIFAVVNSGTSIFAGFLIFTILGFMAQEQGVPIGEVAEGGPGLAFIAYPKAVAQMPIAPLWSILFFIMIILLGLDSQFVGVEGFVTAIVDEYPHILRKGHRKEIFILCVCIGSCLIALTMVTNGGMYVFQLFDHFAGSRIILLVAFFECLVIAWIYGVARFYDNIEDMIGFRINPFMWYSWKYSTFLFTPVMFIMCIVTYKELTYKFADYEYQFPQWAVGIGWSMACVPILMVPIVMVYKIARTPGTFRERIRILTTPILRPHQTKANYTPSVTTQLPGKLQGEFNPAYSMDTDMSNNSLYHQTSPIWHVTNV